MLTLYKMNNTETISWWTIRPEIKRDTDKDGNTVLTEGYYTSWGNDHTTKDNPTDNTQFTSVSDKPTLTLQQQIDSKVNEMIARKGYSRVIPKAAPEMPMLAQKWHDFYAKAESNQSGVVHWPHAFIQPKYDGLRCVSTGLEMYSRRNRKYTAVPHIEATLALLMDSDKFKNVKLDGELYMHGADLQTIQSLVSAQAQNGNMYLHVTYQIFDMMGDNPFAVRYQFLEELVAYLQAAWKDMPESRFKSKVCPIQLTPTDYVQVGTDTREFRSLLIDYNKKFRDTGYEGAIVRNPDAPYQCNYRTFDLLKYKEFCDAEFRIIDVIEAKDSMGTFVCVTDKGNTFKVAPAWTTSRKQQLLRYKDNYVGRWLTVTYERISKDGVPLKPIGKTIRQD